ncbi:MAG: hypothetical protein WA709_33405 [Stellaceae bacterium]
MNLGLGAVLLSLVGDDAALDEWADRLVEVTTEQGNPSWRALGIIHRGWAKVKNGDLTEGIFLLRSGSIAYRATGAEVFMPHYLAFLARACELAGQIEEAVTLLDDGLQIAGRTGERWLGAELNRHKGELILRQGHAEEAEEPYRNALGIAEEQEARPWELRAAVSLAPGCTAIGAATPKPATFWRRSTAGLPRASTQKISSRQSATRRTRGRLMEIAAWLRDLGLETYEAAFRDNDIDWEALPKLTTGISRISAWCSEDIAASCSRRSLHCGVGVARKARLRTKLRRRLNAGS